MYGLADIRAINDAALKDEVARRARVAKNAAYNNELAEATEYVKHLRDSNRRRGDYVMLVKEECDAIADLLVSAYGIQED